MKINATNIKCLRLAVFTVWVSIAALTVCAREMNIFEVVVTHWSADRRVRTQLRYLPTQHEVVASSYTEAEGQRIQRASIGAAEGDEIVRLACLEVADLSLRQGPLAIVEGPNPQLEVRVPGRVVTVTYVAHSTIETVGGRIDRLVHLLGSEPVRPHKSN